MQISQYFKDMSTLSVKKYPVRQGLKIARQVLLYAQVYVSIIYIDAHGGDLFAENFIERDKL